MSCTVRCRVCGVWWCVSPYSFVWWGTLCPLPPSQWWWVGASWMVGGMARWVAW
nr:MAG TPA: Protein of unknown function (DUF723) [Caudoviricetes sp.]